MPKGNAPRGKKIVLRTERMPDGSQIYARGKTTSEKMRSIIKTSELLSKAYRAADRDVVRARTGTIAKDFDAKLARRGKIFDAYLDASRGVFQLSKASRLKDKAKAKSAKKSK